MTKNISRRDFLKLASVGAATTAVLTGCGPASRYVTREPYTKMPEYTYNGLSTFYATTCRECSAGCGLVVRTMQGRALKVEGNPNNPVNLGKTCARGQATLHGLYNPDRVTDPIQRKKRGTGEVGKLDWDAAIQIVADAFTKNKPEEVAFLTGMAPDHLFDLVSDLTQAIGAARPIRFGALGMFEARTTLVKAANEMFGQASLPFFDIGGADLIFSFGANFLETWLSPVAQTRNYAKLRQGTPGRRGTFVQFEARMSQTGAKADEWIPIKPGTEELVVLAIGRLIAEAQGVSLPPAFANVDVNNAAALADISVDALKHLTDLFMNANRPLAIPGRAALGQSNGLQTAEAVLALNTFIGNLGKDGGVYLSPAAPLEDEYHRPASMQEMADLVSNMKSGGVKVLFVHGVNPVFELPKSLGFEDALKNVPQVVSFATFPDETALQADYVFPDNHSLESWGYQKVATGSNSSVLSGAQPVVVPLQNTNTKATVDVLLAAAQKAGGSLASALPFKDEVEFIQSKLGNLITEADGSFSASEINTFSASFQQYGGWWKTTDNRTVPSSADVLNRSFSPTPADFEGDGDFYLLPFVSPILGEAGANKPWLQEVPDPTTTVMWNTWVEINTQKAIALGIEDDDVVKIKSAFGEVEASVYRYPAIRPDTIAMPFGQGHTAYGQFAQGRGVNPVDLVGQKFNEAGDLAFGGMKVTIEKTGRKRALSRDGKRAWRLWVRCKVKGKLERAVMSSQLQLPVFTNTSEQDLGGIWGMAIDQDVCTGCQACVAACAMENNIPFVGEEDAGYGRSMHWIRIERFWQGTFPEVKMTPYQPMMCQQCHNAPCEPVCPVFASVHSASEDLNLQVYNRCVGTRYCANNCPYQVRVFNWRDYTDARIRPELTTLQNQLSPDVTVRRRGVMEKCTFCIQRIRHVEDTAASENREIRDGEVVPACAQACPANAIVFGRIDDPNSLVSQKGLQSRGYKQLEEMGTLPHVTYLKGESNNGSNS